MESEEYLRSELKKIEKWEKDQDSLWFWERLGRLPFKVLDKLTPAFIQTKIGSLLDGIGSFIQTGGQYLTREQTILNKLSNQLAEQKELTLEDVSSLPLKIMDQVSENIKQSESRAATAQGATTGFGGIFTLAIDIPVLLGMSLKTLQDIALTYGYNPRDRDERIFIVKCLQFATSDVVGKKTILDDLNSFYQDKPAGKKEMISQLQGWREVVYTYRDHFGIKKLFQMVPIAGMVFGAITNRSMISDIADAGTMLYRKRRIYEKIQHLQQIDNAFKR